MIETKPVVLHRKNTGHVPTEDTIVLSTLNARYIHASLGLRYLYANLGPLQECACIEEFTINQRVTDIAERLLSLQPTIIGFGVYIWNVEPTTALIKLLKKLRPDIKLVIGGPEVSYEYQHTEIFRSCDFLITGQADTTFRTLCEDIANKRCIQPKQIDAIQPDPKQLVFPYAHYNDEDISHRVMYVEASRGCPFKCSFCLSSLDKTAVPFDLTKLLIELDALYKRGARQFKFVDRTFNLKAANCITILQFFLDKIDDRANELFLHFEVIPDKLPDNLKRQIALFPAGSLQFEIGIQSFNQTVQQTIDRKQNIEKTLDNLQWLVNHTHAHIHADLIFGLPGESLTSFAAGFNQLASLGVHEIQVGILKRLRGSPITALSDEYDMRYCDEPPYQLLENNNIDYFTMQRLVRFARFWDLIANSGRFKHTLPLLLGTSPFQRFIVMCDWIFEQTDKTHNISHNRLQVLVYHAAIAKQLSNADKLHAMLLKDSESLGVHIPRWLKTHTPPPPIGSAKQPVPSDLPRQESSADNSGTTPSATPKRQRRHLQT